MSTRSRRPLPALTGLRFFAAVHVVLLHYVWDELRHPLAVPGGALARGVLSSGYLGVSLFFVLSGFILAYNYLDASGDRPVERAPFWNARIARVYPAYALSLLVAAPTVVRWAVTKFAIEPLPTAAGKVALVGVLNTTLLQAWAPQTVPPWNAPGWSLSVEAFFYATFPFLAPGVARLGLRRPRATLLALWAASLLVPTVYVLLSANPYLSPVGAAPPPMLVTALCYFPLLHLPQFLLGVVVGKLFLARPAAADDGAARRRWGMIADSVAAVYPLLLVLTPLLPYPLLHNGLLAPLYATLLYALAAGDGLVSRLLGTRLLLLLGEASYALYLFHLPILARVHEAGASLGVAWASHWQPVVAAAVVSLVLSIAVLKLVEDPARRVLRRRLGDYTARRGRASVERAVAVTE